MKCICGGRMDRTMNNGGGLSRVKKQCRRCGRSKVTYSRLFRLANGW